MSNSTLKFWIGFSMIPSIGPKRFYKILKYFPTLEDAWNASIAELERSQLEENVIAELLRLRRELDLETECALLEKEGVRAVTIKDARYPALLKQIYTPPPVLFYRGSLPREEEFLLGVVGTRKPTAYGQEVGHSISLHLAQNGITIVSGLALGIDAIAHHAALEAEAPTIAVLACGIEHANIYPMANRRLAEKIIERGGCILSEHPLKTPPLKHHFPQRNRIISGLSLGTLVIEAPAKSGALITAHTALEQNREVFAVPGNITSAFSQGTNNLLKMGAHVASDASSVLDVLNLKDATSYIEAKSIVPDNAEEASILDQLAADPVHIDMLARLTKIPIRTINATLTIMEMKGKVRHLGSMFYAKAR